MIFFFFFFSSRRRHTRCGRDWSSDVCSSDLGATQVVQLLVDRGARMDIRDYGNTDNRGSKELATHTWLPVDYADGLVRVGVQSAIPHPETGKLLRKLMAEKGLPAPAEGRTLESICITDVCQ